MKLRKPLRAAWLRLHRWLGLVLGGWFVLLGLTGSLLVFYVELDGCLDSRLAPKGAARAPSIETVAQALRRAHPQRQDGWRIELPAPGQALVTARYMQPMETAGRAFAPLLVTVDADTGQVVSSRFWGDTALTWLYDLHYALWLDVPGRHAVALAGVAMVCSLLSGLWLWWPAMGRWREALRFKRDASAQRRVYDLHKWSALATLPLLLVLGLSGSMLGWPQLYAPALGVLGQPAALARPASTSTPTRPRLPVDEVLAQVRQRWPQARLRWVDVPGNDPAAAYRIRMRLPGEPGERFPASFVWLDARSGAVLAVRDPAGFNAREVLTQWLHPLHSGEALGLPGRILVCASGLLVLPLAVTGLLRWVHKRRAVRHR